MNARIKEVRKALGLTQEEFGNRLGVGRGAITNIEFEKVLPKDTFISLLCREFSVSEEWLRSGEGEMFCRLTPNEELADLVGQLMADEEDSLRRKVITALMSMSPEWWSVLADEIKKRNRED